MIHTLGIFSRHLTRSISSVHLYVNLRIRKNKSKRQNLTCFSWATARSVMISLPGNIYLPIVQHFDLSLPGSPRRQLTSRSLRISLKVIVFGGKWPS